MDDGWTKNFSKKNKEKKAKDLPIFANPKQYRDLEEEEEEEEEEEDFLREKINNRLSLLRGLEILRRALYLSLAL